MVVYLVTNRIDGKRYVGQTSQALETRWKRHQYPYGHRRGNSYLFNAISKHGIQNFKIEPLVFVETKEEMDFFEQAYIKAWDLRNPEKGYNLTNGGGGMLGFKLSEETKNRMSAYVKTEAHRRKISEAKMGNKSRLGTPHTDEARRRISDAHKGVPLSAAHVAALKAASHRRHHVNRGITNPKCLLCREGTNNGKNHTE
jgi:group I intron endonuclease